MNLALTLKGQDLAELYTITGLSLPSTPLTTSTVNSLKDRVWSLRLPRPGWAQHLAGEFTVDLTGERPFMRADVASQRPTCDLAGYRRRLQRGPAHHGTHLPNGCGGRS
jgi:hypothetical protein